MKFKSVLAELEQYLLKHQHRSSAAQDGEGLPGEQGIHYSSQGGSKQRLNGTLREEKRRSVTVCSSASACLQNPTGQGRIYYAALRRLAQQSAEGDDGGHAGAVEEEERGHTLKTTGVSVVRQVVGKLPLDVQKKSTEPPENTQRKTFVTRAAFMHTLFIRNPSRHTHTESIL